MSQFAGDTGSVLMSNPQKAGESFAAWMSRIGEIQKQQNINMPPTGGVKEKWQPVAPPSAYNPYPVNVKLRRDFVVFDVRNTDKMGMNTKVLRTIKAGTVVSIVKKGSGGNGIVATVFLFLNENEYIERGIEGELELTNEKPTSEAPVKKAIAVAQRNPITTILVAVLVVIILVRIFK